MQTCILASRQSRILIPCIIVCRHSGSGNTRQCSREDAYYRTFDESTDKVMSETPRTCNDRTLSGSGDSRFQSNYTPAKDRINVETDSIEEAYRFGSSRTSASHLGRPLPPPTDTARNTGTRLNSRRFFRRESWPPDDGRASHRITYGSSLGRCGLCCPSRCSTARACPR